MLMFTRGSGWLGLILIWVCAATAFIAPVAAQQQADCNGPAELERTVLRQPTPSACNALSAYFGQREQFACAISAFEAALRLDAKSWEARYNLALALREKGELKRAASELHEAVAHNPTAVNVRSALLSLVIRTTVAPGVFALALFGVVPRPTQIPLRDRSGDPHVQSRERHRIRRGAVH